MKKVLLTAMTLVGIASSTVFGMYGKGDSWIDFLVHGNQLRARMDQLGFTLGNGTIKGTFGFKANTGAMGSILKTDNYGRATLDATISAGIGYTSEMIGVGVGYNYTFVDKHLGVHTPVLMINALNNNLRISAPIQVASASGLNISGTKDVKYTGVAFDNIQLRYYTGIDAFNHIRFMVYYRNNVIEANGNKGISEALGFQLRLYFLNTTVGNANINPYIRLEYHTALKGNKLKDYSASSLYSADPKSFENLKNNPLIWEEMKQSDIYDVNPFEVSIMPTLALSANSDVVSLLFEPSLGYKMVGGKLKEEFAGKDAPQEITHALTWGAYTELYFTPVKDLEWYFEIDVNGNYAKNGGSDKGLNPLSFATGTGLTWYLPSLDGSAQ